MKTKGMIAVLTLSMAFFCWYTPTQAAPPIVCTNDDCRSCHGVVVIVHHDQLPPDPPNELCLECHWVGGSWSGAQDCNSCHSCYDEHHVGAARRCRECH